MVSDPLELRVVKGSTMKFVKFPSIEYYELYQDKVGLTKFIESTPDLAWVTTEKIDGSNFGLSVTRDEYQVQKRTSVIDDPTQDTWGLFTGKARFNDIVEHIRTKFTDHPNINQFIFYGEWYGKGIMKRVYYGDEQYYRFFAIYGIDNNDNLISFPFQTLQTWLTEWNMLDHLVSIISIDHDLDVALSHSNNFVSTLTPSNSVAEGIVICPFNKPAYVRFKSKNEQFKESGNNTVDVVHHFDTDEVEKLHQQFISLCTESRMYGIFSKLGMPVNGLKSSNVYMKAFIEDVNQEMLHIEPKLNDLEYKERKYVSNVGNLIFELFKTVLIKLSNQ